MILCPEINLTHRVTLASVVVELWVTWITGVLEKKLKGIIIKEKVLPVKFLLYG